MSIAVIIHKDVQESNLIIDTLLPNVKNLSETTPIENILNRLGLIFHNENNCRIPFF
jgi:hypothetical protein